ncbi:MAG: ATP-binding protein [candidate division FCPU426 bacterium]
MPETPFSIPGPQALQFPQGADPYAMLPCPDLGLWHWDLPTGSFNYDNRWKEMVGCPPEANTRTRAWWENLIHPEDRPHLAGAVEQIHIYQVPFYEVEYRLCLPDGSCRWILDRGWVSAREADGSVSQLIGLHFDITRRREEQERAKRSYQTQAVLHELINLSLETCQLNELLVKVIERLVTVPWLSLEPAGAVFLAEPNSEAFVLMAALNLPGPACRQCAKIKPGNCFCGRAAKLGQPVIVDTERENLSAFMPPHLHYSLPLLTSEQSVLGVLSLYGKGGRVPDLNEVAFLVNVTQVVVGIVQRARAEETTIRAREAIAANAAKSEFVAHLSHELRTPLNGIIGMTDCLMETGLSVDSRDCAQVIRNSADVLLTLINGVLDLSKIEAGKMTLEERTFDLCRLLEQRRSLFAAQAQEKRLEFVCAVAAGVPRRVTGDEARLSQVLMNLVSNALKFTSAGKVGLEVRTQVETAETALLEFKVSDTGIGIPMDRQAVLFQPYVQAEASISRDYGGTGLGLSISRRLVELMGGRIGLESEPGRGSTFWFTVEVRKPAAGEEPGPKTESQGENHARPDENRVKGSILVAEDNPTNQNVIRRMLGKLGYQPILAGNGREALELLEQRAFDLIFMDIQMPEMDGLTATRKIRFGTLPELRRAIPIVAMTAHALASDREKCLNAGMNDFITKPIRLDALAETLQKNLPANHPAPAPESEPKREPAAEDDGKVFSYSQALERFGGDRELLIEILDTFSQDAPAQIDGLTRAWSGGAEAQEVANRAHTLKGAAGNAGALSLQDMAAALQHAAEAGDLKKAETLVQAIPGEYARFQDAWKRFSIQASEGGAYANAGG